MRSCSFVVLLCAAVVPASAFDWQFEQVDTAGNWSSPSLRMSGTGILHFCYRAPGNQVVHSYLDSAWHREEIGPFETLAGYRMDAGAHGELGLLLRLTAENAWLYEKQDTSWRGDSVTVPLDYFSYDSEGVPSGIFRRGDTILYSRRAESTWVSEMVDTVPNYHSYSVCAFTHTVKGEPCVAIYDLESGTYYKGIFLFVEQADTWRVYGAASGGETVHLRLCRLRSGYRGRRSSLVHVL